MFNLKGEVVGIFSFILRNSKGFQGLGFATTSNVVNKKLLDECSVGPGVEAFYYGVWGKIYISPRK